MDPTVILASVLLGLLVAWIASEAIGTQGGIEGRDDLSPQELSRRELCRRNRWYELFEPLIRRISVFIERSIPEKVTAL